ncbi:MULTISPECIES: PDR/VanB family oxidoreductase [unclassified Streptomyces]|uniref:PDR/VanB family oxidoreductase n=1 Tax=unclassified Streptomyces TaxID=2593676 RepID=UPI0022520BB6|nr:MULTISPECIES: PDR/VanB family oxidoreductase [unclassified Streptomyces]MCX4641959.1 PDR/VanB family oxidoreductase [Streptomyces sp. NBC_01446]MCX5085694.1 PDR/VanB family oxidoreductase [Streptomyces sp. NBC_00401]MCX5326833.1 PDR/VanB family oxidoreductase [Streptomyces sp. NBC_00120]
MSTTWTEVVVVARHDATPRIAVFDLARTDGEELWGYEPGAHIDVQVGELQLVRQYSLCGPPGVRKQYRIAVLNDPASRGGSRAMHGLAEGDRLRIAAPRNRFGLTAARRHILLAGGIGVTPLLSMAQALDDTGGDYHLHYCARSRGEAAFAADLENHPRVTLHFDDQTVQQRLDMARDVGGPDPETAVYVCGPGGFMDHVLGQAVEWGWPAAALHKERFSASAATAEPSASDAGAFTVKLSSTGTEYAVPEDQSVLDVLHANGVDAPYSCGQGICGECIVRVLSGEPDHRDDVLTDDERAQGMYTPCSSRSLSPVLELEL